MISSLYSYSYNFDYTRKATSKPQPPREEDSEVSKKPAENGVLTLVDMFPELKKKEAEKEDLKKVLLFKYIFYYNWYALIY